MGTNQCSCQWKLVDSDKFVLGVPADRCGGISTIKVLRPNRKTDLYLCEDHFNSFIATWGLFNQVEILCPKPKHDFSRFGREINKELIRHIVQCRREQ